MRLIYALLLVSISMIVPFEVNAQTRHALVIGIDDYAHVAPLQKARNDARAVAAALGPAGFRVTALMDPDRRAMTQALGRFAAGLAQGDEALFYFAGHGIEVDGQNYLLPADIPEARPGDEDFLIAEAIGVDHVLASLQRRGVRVSLLILDACRDNPFPRQGTRSLGTTRGLGRVTAPEGSFVLFSAGAGQAALDRLGDDDADPNSVFTRALLPRLTQPGLDLRGMVQQVRSDVRRTAMSVGHDQFPAVYDQLDGNFRFLPAAMIEAEPAPITGTADPCASALPVWSAIQNSDSTAALEGFAETYASTCPALAALAQDRIAALAPTSEPEPDWTRATYVTLSGHTNSVRSAAFSPDGGRIVTASSDNTARVWDAATGREIATLSGHMRFVLSAAFSPDGGRIVTASSDNTARVWDAATGRVVATLSEHTAPVRSAAFSPDGGRIVTGSDDRTARVWDAATGRVIATLSGHANSVTSATFSPDGRRILTASNQSTARVWDAATGRVLATLSGHTRVVRSAAFSPDGGRIVTGSFDNTARLWNAATGRVIATLSGHTDRVWSAAFSPDGRRIVTASGDTTARIWTAP